MSILKKVSNKLTKERGEFKGKLPNHCPICRSMICPEPLFEYNNLRNKVFRTCFCPACNNTFIATYEFRFTTPILIGTTPKIPEEKIFSEWINELSPRFQKIYNQSLFAQENKLDEIAGIGFRKSLEVLIKDYAIYLHSDKKEEIEKVSLGRCIENYIDDENIKILAKGSKTIGNSQTHYVNNIEDPGLIDLKSFINSIVDLIDAKRNIEHVMSKYK